MTKATLRGKPDAGNLHVRFDEGEVASENLGRGSLLYKRIHLLVAVLALAGSVQAQIEWGAPFSDGMVLQREMKVPVWGWAKPGEKISVSFADQTASCVADTAGVWRVSLKPLKASKEGRDLRANDAVLHGVLVGEVWICSGQSNMSFPMCGANPRYSDRMGYFYSQWLRRPYVRVAQATNYKWNLVEQRRHKGKINWVELNPDLLRNAGFSAVGTYFAVDLADALDIPIGLIGAYWGGSTADAWTPRCGQLKHPELKDLCDRPTFATQKEWDAAPKELTTHHPFTQPYQQLGAMFNEMVAPLCPLACRGFIWYQGCHHWNEPERYCSKLHALYDGWREKFENPKLKMYVAQLAPWNFSNVWKLWQAQDKFVAEEPNAEIAVINDVGNNTEIHPWDKMPVGRRLAALALKHDYGFNIKADSPKLKSWKLEGNTFVLTFTDADSFYIHPYAYNSTENGFEIQGEDGKWKPATIANLNITTDKKGVRHCNGTINGHELRVVADGIKKPKGLRYMQSLPFKMPVFNEVGLPIGWFAIDVK